MSADPAPLDPRVEDLLTRVRTLTSTDGAATQAVGLFREAVWEHRACHGRDLPWHHTRDPYRILLSEVMLQQTQVDRVRPKYEAFLAALPDLAALAAARFEDVLSLWKGLGYNRRALALKRAAQIVIDRHGGEIPRDEAALLDLPGIGPATAAGVRCFAWGEPDVYLETNVRAATLFAFFPERHDVPDREVRDVVAATLDREHPREWYYALMDLGAALKRAHPNPSRASRHHARQSAFQGSDRQIRGRVLEQLLSEGATPTDALSSGLAESLEADASRVADIVDALVGEGLLAREGERVRIA